MTQEQNIWYAKFTPQTYSIYYFNPTPPPTLSDGGFSPVTTPIPTIGTLYTYLSYFIPTGLTPTPYFGTANNNNPLTNTTDPFSIFPLNITPPINDLNINNFTQTLTINIKSLDPSTGLSYLNCLQIGLDYYVFFDLNKHAPNFSECAFKDYAKQYCLQPFNVKGCESTQIKIHDFL